MFHNFKQYLKTAAELCVAFNREDSHNIAQERGILSVLSHVESQGINMYQVIKHDLIKNEYDIVKTTLDKEIAISYLTSKAKRFEDKVTGNKEYFTYRDANRNEMHNAVIDVLEVAYEEVDTGNEVEVCKYSVHLINVK